MLRCLSLYIVQCIKNNTRKGTLTVAHARTSRNGSLCNSTRILFLALISILQIPQKIFFGKNMYFKGCAQEFVMGNEEFLCIFVLLISRKRGFKA